MAGFVRLQAPISSMSIISIRVTPAEQLPWVWLYGASETAYSPICPLELLPSKLM